MNRDLFARIIGRIVRVLKHNYLNEFNKKQIQDITTQECEIIPRLGFNSLRNAKGQSDLADKDRIGKQANMFGMIARRMQAQNQRIQKAQEATANLIRENNPFAGNQLAHQRNMTMKT